MKEILISLEVGKLAKEKGFAVNTEYVYCERIAHTWENPRDGDIIDFEYIPPRVILKHYCDEYNIEICEAPSQSILQKWLRDTHRLHVGISINQFGYGFMYSVVDLATCSCVVYLTGGCDYKYTYEEALEAGLMAALKLIKQ